MENGGPFRVPRPADRKAASRQESTQRQPQEAQAVNSEPKAPHRATSSSHASKKPKSLKRFILPALIVIVLGIAAFFAWSKLQNTGIAIDSNKYQAVFFTNGQVYFGKLNAVNSEYMQLTDIFYLQSQQATNENGDDSSNPQETSSDKNGVQLIKLGDEIHGPEDKMVISKDQVLFYENLKSDGKVAQSIEKFKAPK